MHFKIALIQMKILESKATNVLYALSRIKEAARKGAKMVILPEYFTNYKSASHIRNNAEELPHKTIYSLKRSSEKQKVTIIAGSIPELHDGLIYNSSYVIHRGNIIDFYRKLHLNDVDIPNKLSVKESNVITPGNKILTIKLNQKFPLTIGLAIGHDLWFPELAQAYRKLGCQLLVYPASFNQSIGSKYFELLQRSRAIDNQCYVATVSAARDESKSAPFVAWGHSSVVDPWGEVIATTDHRDDIVYANIDLEYVKEVASRIPLQSQKRKDIYELVLKY